jgi:RNA polymerase I specific initiation factor
MSSLFSLPLPTYQQPSSKSSSQELKSKKRKRKGPTDHSSKSQDVLDHGIQSLPQSEVQASSQSLEYTAVLTPEERIQYRAAGQPFDQEPPPFPFPHSATKTDRKKSMRSDMNAKRPPPVPTLHLQHLSVITAILHRSLAEHDYARASRAFGLILRDSIGGHTIDVRNEGRWGIGAEILLKSSSQHDCSPDKHTEDGNRSQQAPMFTRQGFERAKRYYERLIVQYPFNKTHPTSVNALDFYQALFGLWIYIVHEEGKTGSTMSPELSQQDAQHGELEQALEIAGRMDACMSSIPFSDDLELIRLRGMVASWIADLAESRSGHQSHILEGDREDTETSPVLEGV